jgi:trigger factor
MQVSVEATGSIQRKMTIEVPAERIDQEVDKRLLSMRGKVRMDGFRPGKVPLSIVKKMHGVSVYQEVAGEVIQASFYEAAVQEKLRVVGLPDIEAKTFEYGKNVEFIARFDIYPDIEIVSLEGNTVTQQSADIGEADVDKMIETLSDQQKEWVDVDRAAEKGDLVTVDFSGLLEGETFEGGDAKDFQVEIGAGRMLVDFETALTGMSAGEEKTSDVAFPEDYHSEKLQGKTVQFTQSVKTVQGSEKPEIDEDFIKKFGIEEGSMESFRSNILDNMQRELNNAIHTKVKMQVMEQLSQAHEFEAPAALVSDEIKHIRAEMNQNTGSDMDMASLPDDLFHDQAEKRVRLGLIVGEIIRQKDIQKDEAKIEAKLEELSSTYEDPSALINYYRSNEQAMQTIEAAVMEDLIVEWALEQITIEYEISDFDTIMKKNTATTV